MAARQSNQPSTPNLYDASAWRLAHDAWLRRQRFERRSLALAFDKCYGAVLQTNVVTQIRNRLREDSVYLAGAGDVAACVLRSFECLYANGAASYFEAVVGALDALVERGYHLPRTDAVRALRETARSLAGQDADVDAAVAAYSERVVAAAQITAPQLGNGVFVMTAHQAKGKEFDTVILASPLARHYPDTEEGRRLFYAAVTRATARWVVVAPNANTTPLLQTLGI